MERFRLRKERDVNQSGGWGGGETLFIKGFPGLARDSFKNSTTERGCGKLLDNRAQLYRAGDMDVCTSSSKITTINCTVVKRCKLS